MQLEYRMPTEFVMEENCVDKNADRFAGYGKKALIVTGASSAKKTGALGDVLAALEKNGQDYALFDRAEPNPLIESVYAGVAFAKGEGVNFVIAIGGGSPMDTAKAIAVVAAQDGDIPRERLFTGPYKKPPLSMVFIPTTAGTGSEVTPYAVLTDHSVQNKATLVTVDSFPDLALLDGKYLVGMPHHIMVNTVVDAMSHSMEGMLSAKANPFTDLLAVESIRLISQCFPALKGNNLSGEQRERLLYASTLGGMVITRTGTTIVHGMGYPMTYHRDIDHGRANGLLLPAFMAFTAGTRPDRVQLVLDAFGAKDVETFAAALDELLGKREKFTLEELEMYTMASDSPRKTQNCIVPPSREDIAAIYAQALLQD